MSRDLSSNWHTRHHEAATDWLRPGRLRTSKCELVLAIVWPYSETMPVLTDGSYDGTGCRALTPVPRRTDGIPLHVDQRAYNRLLRGLCCLGERGFALLIERRKALRHATMSPSRITNLARAVFVLTEFKQKIITHPD